jgi:hypothetical protein
MTVYNQTMDVEASLSTIEAMLAQEKTGYTVPDYMLRLPAHTAFGQPVDADARYSIADWCFKIMDICRYKRETAAIAMSCLDRFVSTPDGYQMLLDRRKFQLAALTAVYTAVKVHEQQALAPHLIARLSHGSYSTEDIETMEFKMLMALQWRVNPPTAMEFVCTFLEVVPENVLDEKSRIVVIELVQYQIDLSVVDYEFCRKGASSIAFASLLNSVECIHNDAMLCSYIESMVAQAVNINSHHFIDLRDRLNEAITHQSGSDLLLKEKSKRPSCCSIYSSSSESSYSKSPISVHVPKMCHDRL